MAQPSGAGHLRRNPAVPGCSDRAAERGGAGTRCIRTAAGAGIQHGTGRGAERGGIAVRLRGAAIPTFAEAGKAVAAAAGCQRAGHYGGGAGDHGHGIEPGGVAEVMKSEFRDRVENATPISKFGGLKGPGGGPKRQARILAPVSAGEPARRGSNTTAGEKFNKERPSPRRGWRGTAVGFILEPYDIYRHI